MALIPRFAARRPVGDNLLQQQQQPATAPSPFRNAEYCWRLATQQLPRSSRPGKFAPNGFAPHHEATPVYQEVHEADPVLLTTRTHHKLSAVAAFPAPTTRRCGQRDAQ